MSEVVSNKKKAGFSAAEYNSVAVAATLHAINLLASSFKVDVEEMNHAEDWRLSYNRKFLACHYDAERNQVAAIMQFQVIGRSGRKQAMKCTADYGVFYEVPRDATEEAAIGFCRNVGSFAAYPYFRSLVAQLAWNAGLTLPPMPSIASTAHIPSKKQLQSQEEESNEEA